MPHSRPRILTDALDLAGLHHATPQDRRALAWRAALCAIVCAIVATRSVPHALVLGAGLAPAVVLATWLKVSRRG
ncbi:MAG: hypothetical protein KDD82_31660 [Planctomycetes bacterium]|nr:hypothetical protein [Planctomycetota bacterium]